MRYGSMFSGIEAASVAWKPLGWQCQWVCEIEPFPSAVLAHHYPDVPNLGDVTKVDWDHIRATRPVDLMVFGSPCQSFSVAGKRLGLDDPRGNLALYALSVVKRLRPRWFLFENVPGLLSSGGGRDFGAFLATVGECGYQCAWRVLDAQYIRVDTHPRAVPQRRRRVFVVGCLGDWRRAAAVLFERESLCGHPAPRREAGKGFAASPARSVAIRGRDGTPQAELGDDCANTILTPNGGRGGVGVGAVLAPQAYGLDEEQNANLELMGTLKARTAGGGFEGVVAHSLVPAPHAAISPALNDGVVGSLCADSHPGAYTGQDAYTGRLIPCVTHSLRADGFDASEDGTGRGTPLVPVAFAPQAGGTQTTLGYDPESGICQTPGANQTPAVVSPSLTAFNMDSRSPQSEEQQRAVSAVYASSMQVRRLTPMECERLQGFPSMRERVTIEVCLDRQNASADVALSCLRWPSNASRADAERYPRNAGGAAKVLNTSPASQEPLVALRVRTNSEDELLEIRSRGRLIWSASNAATSSKFPRPIQGGNIAAVVVPPSRDLAQAIRAGKVESPQSIRVSFPVANGGKSAPKYGNESVASASDATSGVQPATFTTCTLGALAPTCGSPVATLLCSVLAAISGCIPSETLPDSFSLEIDLETPYTLITVRNKPAADGPRYKALGNSMAVNVMRHIGQRIQLVETALVRELEAA